MASFALHFLGRPADDPLVERLRSAPRAADLADSPAALREAAIRLAGSLSSGRAAIMNASRNTNSLVYWSARRALSGVAPESLRAYSFLINIEKNEVLLRAHFACPPSEEDLETISLAETEIMTDLWDDCETRTDVEIVPEPEKLLLLEGGIAYLRDGDVETISS